MSRRRRTPSTAAELEQQRRWASTMNIIDGLRAVEATMALGSPNQVADLLLFDVAEYTFHQPITASGLRRVAAFAEAFATTLDEGT